MKMKIPDTIGLVANFNTNTTEMENKTPKTSNIIKKTDFDAKKISAIRMRYLILVI